MKALTAAEMREVDRLTTERHGISGAQLMETAGGRAADAVWRVIAGRENVNICVLCGRGNNGGDGFVVARLLKEERKTHASSSLENQRKSMEMPPQIWLNGKTLVAKSNSLPANLIGANCGPNSVAATFS